MSIQTISAVNLYGESHGKDVKLRSNPVRTCQATLARILRAPRHPGLNLVCGTEYNPSNPAGTGFHTERKISASEVMAMMKSGASFVYKIHIGGHRIKWIREVRYRRHECGPRQDCYRTNESASLQPSPEWVKRMMENTSYSSMIWNKRD